MCFLVAGSIGKKTAADNRIVRCGEECCATWKFMLRVGPMKF
jgi:hypothetical protein